MVDIKPSKIPNPMYPKTLENLCMCSERGRERQRERETGDRYRETYREREGTERERGRKGGMVRDGGRGGEGEGEG